VLKERTEIAEVGEFVGLEAVMVGTVDCGVWNVDHDVDWIKCCLMTVDQHLSSCYWDGVKDYVERFWHDPR